MNIFYLDKSFAKSAQYHCDKHVVKMILETAQLLSTAHRELDGDEYADKVSLYKSTHKNHPSAVWVRSNQNAYNWAFMLLYNLCAEYTKRYNKTHKTSKLLNSLVYKPENIKFSSWNDTLTPPPQCMPDEYKHENTVTAYRNYYFGAKKSFAKWAYSATPDWWVQTEEHNELLAL
jgi:hypothetical protein